jgi:hypothetical protein
MGHLMLVVECQYLYEDYLKIEQRRLVKILNSTWGFMKTKRTIPWRFGALRIKAHSNATLNIAGHNLIW